MRKHVIIGSPGSRLAEIQAGSVLNSLVRPPNHEPAWQSVVTERLAQRLLEMGALQSSAGEGVQ